MNQLPRVVPWTSYQELDQVRSWLYSESPEKAQLGVDRIKAWSARGKIPVALESTAGLIRAKLCDYADAKVKLSSSELRLMYGMALVRFVNGAVDSAQKSTYALNLYQLARVIGLPARFIDIRHALSHEELPTLPVLRDACQHALQWLYDFFWKVALRENGPDPEIDVEKVQKLQQIVTRYKKSRKSYLKNLKERKNRAPDSSPYQNALQKLKKMLTPVVIKEGLVPILLEAGGLIPAGKSKRASVKSMSLSDDVLELWIPLLQTVSNVYPDFGNYLLVRMTEKLDNQPKFVFSEKLAYLAGSQESEQSQPVAEDGNKGSSYLLTLVCWIQFILRNESAEDTDKIFDEISLDDVLEACLRKPNYYTRNVLQTIISVEPDLEEPLEPFLKYFERILASSVNKKSEDRPQLDESAMQSELATLMDQIADCRGQYYKDSEGSAWQLYDASKWKPCPIGTLPDGSVPKLDLQPIKRRRTR